MIIADRDLAGALRDRFVEHGFPSARHVDAEPPRGRRVRFLTSQHAGSFVVRGVITM